MERAKGILYAALSSSTFGLAPLFTLLLAGGYSPFEALSYRWGVAALFPGALAVCSGRSFRLGHGFSLSIHSQKHSANHS